MPIFGGSAGELIHPFGGYSRAQTRFVFGPHRDRVGWCATPLPKLSYSPIIPPYPRAPDFLNYRHDLRVGLSQV